MELPNWRGYALDWLRDAIVAHKAREMGQQWQDVGQALLQLLRDEEALAQVPPEAAWAIVDGLLGGVRDMESAVRRARRHDLPPKARRATGDLLYALGEVRDVLERYVVPQAERRFGAPPRQN